jgi:tetratricopeptide (TPR) repeat protein
MGIEKQTQRLYLKGLNVSRSGNWLRALQYFRQCLEIDPDFSPAHYEIGLLYYKNGHGEEALPHLIRAVELNGQNIQYHFALANVYLALNQPGQALEIYKKLEKMNSEPSPALYLNMGIAYKAMVDFERAKECFHRSIQLAPQNPEALDHLGRLYLEQGRHEEAKVVFQKLVKLNPNYLGAHQALGYLYAKESNWQKAIDEWNLILAFQPHREDLLYQVSKAQIKLNQPDKAIKTLRRILNIHPDFLAARLDVIALLISLERWEEALLELEYAEKLDPKNPTLQHLLQEIKIRNRAPSQKEE